MKSILTNNFIFSRSASSNKPCVVV